MVKKQYTGMSKELHCDLDWLGDKISKIVLKHEKKVTTYMGPIDPELQQKLIAFNEFLQKQFPNKPRIY